MTPTCVTHPDRLAAYECDGCGKHLCEECIEEGHRLLFCRLCGERALPLAAGAPATTTELARDRKINAEYSMTDALLYPFRGLGLYVYAGYVLLLVVFDLIGWLPGIGCLVGLFQLLITLILPGFLFKIVRDSAHGEVELPDWPDWTDTGERLGEWFAFLLIMVMSVLPLWGFLWLNGCGLGELVRGEWGVSCLMAVALGVVIGVALWVPAIGAVGTWGSAWLAPRADLHVKALIATWGDAWVTIALLAGLWWVSVVLRVLLSFVPVLGSVSQIAIGVYTLLVGAHLIGLVFRRSHKILEAIYLG